MPTLPASTSVEPYLSFGGRCEDALKFYRDVIGAEIVTLMRFSESPEKNDMPECFQDKVMHATLRIGKTNIMASDGRCEGPSHFDGFSLSIALPDEASADLVFNALAEGGLVTSPLEKVFWSPKFGVLQDKFGVTWMVSVLP